MIRFLTLTAAAALFATSAAAQAQFEGDGQRSGGQQELNAGMGVTHSGSDHNEASPGGMQSGEGDWRSGGQSGWQSSESGDWQQDAEQDDDDFAFNTDACSRPH